MSRSSFESVWKLGVWLIYNIVYYFYEPRLEVFVDHDIEAHDFEAEFQLLVVGPAALERVVHNRLNTSDSLSNQVPDQEHQLISVSSLAFYVLNQTTVLSKRSRNYVYYILHGCCLCSYPGTRGCFCSTRSLSNA